MTNKHCRNVERHGNKNTPIGQQAQNDYEEDKGERNHRGINSGSLCCTNGSSMENSAAVSFPNQRNQHKKKKLSIKEQPFLRTKRLYLPQTKKKMVKTTEKSEEDINEEADYTYVGKIGSRGLVRTVDGAINQIFPKDDEGNSFADKFCHYNASMTYRDVMKAALPDVERALTASTDWDSVSAGIVGNQKARTATVDESLRVYIVCMFLWDVAHGLSVNISSPEHPKEKRRNGRNKLVDWKGTKRGAGANCINCLLSELMLPALKLLAKYYDEYGFIETHITGKGRKNGVPLLQKDLFDLKGKLVTNKIKHGGFAFDYILGMTPDLDKEPGYAVQGLRTDFMPSLEKYMWNGGIMRTVLEGELHMTAEQKCSLPAAHWPAKATKKRDAGGKSKKNK